MCIHTRTNTHQINQVLQNREKRPEYLTVNCSEIETDSKKQKQKKITFLMDISDVFIYQLSSSNNTFRSVLLYPGFNH